MVEAVARRRILIVEEEPLIGWSLANALGKAGYETDLVECGEEAVDLARHTRYDLVISDARLPRMHGAAFAARLKDSSGPVPFILISAHEDEEAVGGGGSPDVDHVVEKPFNVAELVRLVGEVLAATESDLRNPRETEN